MPVQITPIVSATPVIVEAVAPKTYDSWFLKNFQLYSTPQRTFNAKVLWSLGKLNVDGTSELSATTGFCFLENILADTILAENPEIAAVLPQFLAALEAVSRRKNAIS